MDSFFLRWKLDHPVIEQGKSDDVYVLVTIEPNPASFAPDSDTSLPAHLILLVDVSDSMRFLIRHDPDAKSVGEGLTEGQESSKVVSSVPSRRETACLVVRKLVERLRAEDRLTIVAFDSKAYVLTHNVSALQLDAIQEAIDSLQKIGGGGTSLGEGLHTLRELLPVEPESNQARRMLLLTDGMAEDPERSLNEARLLGREWHIPIAAFGTGECKVAFLTDLAKTTLAGSFHHLRNESDAEQLFQQVLIGQQNVQAVNARLDFWLAPEILAQELYRIRPETLFIGDLQPNAEHVVELPLEQMERGKAYEFLFRCTVPGKTATQRMRIVKAGLTYDIPVLGKWAEKIESNIVVEFTGDAERARERSGDVHRILTRAEVQRQVLFLQRKVDRMHAGQATIKDRRTIALILQTLIAKFEEFGDHAMKNQYQQMLEEFLSRGKISQEMLNRSLAASSRFEEIATVEDFDF